MVGEEVEVKPSAYDGLNDRQRAFVDNYLSTNFNASRSARMAGYAQPHSQAHRLLENVVIKAAIKERMGQTGMEADEAIKRLANLARFNMSEFVRVPTFVQPTSLVDDKQPIGEDDPVIDTTSRNLEPYVDVAALIDAGYGYAIKAIKHTPNGSIIEFHDPVAALRDIGKVHGLFIDKGEIDHRHMGANGGAILLGAVSTQLADEELEAWREQQRKQTAKLLNG